MKNCIKCGLLKPLEEYYRHAGLTDGHLNKCKTCAKAEAKVRQQTKSADPEWVEQERARGREKAKRLGYTQKYKPKAAEKAERLARYAAKYPEKAAARILAQHIKPLNTANRLHHWNYRPEHATDMIEVGFEDHYTIHRFIRYDQSHMMYRRKSDNVLLESREMHEAWIAEILQTAYAVAA